MYRAPGDVTWPSWCALSTTLVTLRW